MFRVACGFDCLGRYILARRALSNYKEILVPIALDSIRNYARRKGNRVLCGRTDCGYEFGGIRKGIDRWRPNIDYRPGQRKLAPEEEQAIVEEIHYDRLSNLLSPSEWAEYSRSEVRIKDDYVRELVAYEWDFCFNDGWIERSDGVWGVSRRSERRMKRGSDPRFRRPVVHHTTRQVEFAIRQPERWPIAVECPLCDLLQLADVAKLALRPAPLRRIKAQQHSSDAHWPEALVHEIEDTLCQLQALGDALHDQGVQGMRLDKALRRNGLTLSKVNEMAVHKPEKLKAILQRDPELKELVADDSIDPFNVENIRAFREKMHEFVGLVSVQAQR